jgi:transketolase
MLHVGAEDSNLVVIVGDISHGILKPFSEKYPTRYYNIGILEPAMMSIAAGLNRVGLNPVVHTIAPFLIERSFEQIKLDFGYQELSVSLVSVGGTFDYSQLGVSHHSYSDVALISEIPGSKVFVPGSADEFRKLFAENYPTFGVKYFRLTENPHGASFTLPQRLGHESIRVLEGKDLTIITTGAMLRGCLEAAQIISADYSVDLLHFPTVRPFDSDGFMKSVLRTGRYLSVDELSPRGGLSSAVLETLAGVPQIDGVRLSVTSMLHGYGSREDLLDAAGLSVENIVAAARKVLG